MKYQKCLYKDIPVGSIFCIKQEIDNYDYMMVDNKYILSYRKVDDSRYESKMVIQDYRRNPSFINPKIYGYLYKEAEIYLLDN